jgi:O-antigen/teichoic acid export membrane protein
LAFATINYPAFVVLVWIFAPPLALLLSGEADNAGAVQAGAVCIAANGVMLVLQGQLRWALRPRDFATIGVTYLVLVLGGMEALVGTGTASVARVLWLQGGVAAAAAMAGAWALRNDLVVRLDRAEIGVMLRFSLPLVPVGIAMFATLNLDRFVLNSLSTLDEVALFGIAGRLTGVATLVLLGVQSALTPLVYAHHHEPETPARLARLLEIF